MILLRFHPFPLLSRFFNRKVLSAFGLSFFISTLSLNAADAIAGESELSPHMVRGIEAFHYGDVIAAKALFTDHLERYPADEIALLYLARTSLLENDIDTAKASISKAVKIDPQNEEIAFRYGEVMGRAAQQANRMSALSLARQALEGFERAVEIAPDNTTYRTGLMRFHLAAPSLVGGKKESAIEQAMMIKKLVPYEGIFALLEVYDSLDDHANYQATIEEALKEYPKDAELYIKLGKLKETQKESKLAIQHFDQAFLYAEEQLAILGPGEEEESEDETRARVDALETLFHAKFQQGRMRALSGNDLDACVKVLRDFVSDYPNRENVIVLDWALWYLASCHEQKTEYFRADHIHTLLKNVTSEPNIREMLERRHGVIDG